ncbi:MAG: radical SAM protein [Bacteroidetes bacterium]|nr:radical SAM protein [Bacteroidota bacterium]
MSVLYNNIVFGPIVSRRFGSSLGINLLPLQNKVCNFNCIYCECGWTDLKSNKIKYLGSSEIITAIENRFKVLKKEKIHIDSITFAGNGEPTMHPKFSEIIDAVIQLRDIYLPKIKITVLSNSTLLGNKSVFESLKKIDLRVMKLDAGNTDMLKKIDKPLSSKTIEWYIEKLKELNGELIIQTIFLKGYCDGVYVDNTTTDELSSWLNAIKEINPKSVMIYTIDRETPADKLEKISAKTLNSICDQVLANGINANVYT